jgi:hypothetical protein
MRALALATLPLVLLACEREPQGTDCMCQPQTALETPFDNMSSTLGADNVQDAIDELDARPLSGRHYFTEWFYTPPATLPGSLVSGPCDENPGHLALAVTCEFGEGGDPDPTVVPLLQQQGVHDAVGFCGWFTTDGRPWGGRFKMRVLCLDPTP